MPVHQNFNPRTPGGVRLNILGCYYHIVSISIHAPRVGCDLTQRKTPFPFIIYFNPRTPGGVRHVIIPYDPAQYTISIHAPRVGCDKGCHNTNRKPREFQSTHPGWGATRSTVKAPRCKLISIHAPRVGCDQRYQRQGQSRAFQSTHPGWGATYL